MLSQQRLRAKFTNNLSKIRSHGMRFINDTRGDLSDRVIGLTVALIMIGAVGVVGINYIETANTTGWATNTVTIFTLLGLIAVLGFFLMILNYSRRK